MKVLAWYTLIASILSIILTIAKSEEKGGWRIFGVIIYLPILIFALKFMEFI